MYWNIFLVLIIYVTFVIFCFLSSVSTKCVCVYHQFVSLECLMTSVTDMFPSVFRRAYRRELLLLCLCTICFFLGLLLVTEVRTVSAVHKRKNLILLNWLFTSLNRRAFLVFEFTSSLLNIL